LYPVSEAFLEAVKQNTRRYYWTGKITTKAGTEYEFGAAAVDTGFCIASVMGQGMGAGDAWDGKIEIEEYVERFAIGTGTLSGRLRSIGFTESTLWEIDELVQRSYSDIKNGRSSIGGFAVQVDVAGSNT
jgi:hypothetical protein